LVAAHLPKGVDAMLLAMLIDNSPDSAGQNCTAPMHACKSFAMHRSLIAAIAFSSLVAACAVQVARPPVIGDQRPDGFPASYYLQLSQRGGEVLRIDPAQSLMVIEVRRAGSLANLGHDHVVASHDIQGYIAPSEGRADFYIRLDQLVVDEPQLRAEAAFDTQPSESAIAGTRENMLRQFNAEAHPYAVIAVERVVVDTTGTQLDISLSLKGVTRALRVPAKIEQTAGQIGVTGRVTLAQTAFGIAPFSILGGGLQVQDQVDVRIAIRARSLQP
jgi:hypothetical protein